MMVIHVVVAFRSGHPELSPRNTVFSAVKTNGMLVAGSEGAAIHPAAAAREGEPIVVKHRISSFVGTDLETLLRANGIVTLVLAGVHTSGVVLSTVRHAVDLDYRLVVVRDCCADPDAGVHAMLLDIVIPKQAAVVTMAELASALAAIGISGDDLSTYLARHQSGDWGDIDAHDRKEIDASRFRCECDYESAEG
jgi:nicotinamidase-related amidase